MFLVDLIDEVISGIDTTLNVLSKTQNTDGNWEVVFNDDCSPCQHVWLAPCAFYDSEGTQVRLLEINNDVYVFDNEPNDTISQSIFYLHGRKVPVNAELNRINFQKKFPLVYLFETLCEEYFEDSNRLLKESSVRIYFLNHINQNDWKTDDHYYYALYPMQNLVNAFISALQRFPKFANLRGYKVLPLVKFGNYDNNGSLKWIFDNAPSSGLCLEIDIPIIKEKYCKNKC